MYSAGQRLVCWPGRPVLFLQLFQPALWPLFCYTATGVGSVVIWLVCRWLRRHSRLHPQTCVGVQVLCWLCLAFAVTGWRAAQYQQQSFPPPNLRLSICPSSAWCRTCLRSERTEFASGSRLNKLCDTTTAVHWHCPRHCIWVGTAAVLKAIPRRCLCCVRANASACWCA